MSKKAKLWLPKSTVGLGGVVELNWEFEINIYTLPYIK